GCVCADAIASGSPAAPHDDVHKHECSAVDRILPMAGGNAEGRLEADRSRGRFEESCIIEGIRLVSGAQLSPSLGQLISAAMLHVVIPEHLCVGDFKSIVFRAEP